MKKVNICYSNSECTYYCTGNGPQLVVMLHGYGETGAHFAALAGCFPPGFTLLAPDLPFHGETKWDPARRFSPDELMGLIYAMAVNEGHTLTTFTLTGYSMGGRLSLALYRYFPEKIKALILLAPDGLHRNFWYWLSVHTVMGNRLFRYTLSHPRWFNVIINNARKTGLVNESIYKLVTHFMEKPRAREELYTRWTKFGSFRPDISYIKKEIEIYHSPVCMIYGRYDKIITLKGAGKFRSGIEGLVKIEIIDSGHRLLQGGHEKEVMQKINNLCGFLFL